MNGLLPTTRFIAVCILLGLIVCGFAQGAPSFVRMWGSNGSAAGQLYNPYGVYIDPFFGYIYAADSGNSRIESFTTTGAFVNQFGSPGFGPGQFLQPSGVAVNSSGYVYIADTGNSRVQIFSPAGTYVADWPTAGGGPWGIAVNNTGYIYITASTTNDVEAYNPSGVLVASWGSLGPSPGQFDSPLGVATNASGYVYVTDWNNNRTQIFDPSGTYISLWGTGGAGNGQFSFPSGIAIDGAGQVYVADSGNWRIEEFDPSGTYVDKWGTNGISPGQFGFVNGIAATPAGTIYTIDTGIQRIQQFSPAGSGPTAGFTGTPLFGNPPLSVAFTDASVCLAPMYWNWSFGDGEWFNNTDSAYPNTNHVYTTPGTYTVSVTITNLSGSNTLTRPNYISVGGTPGNLRGYGGDNSDNGPPGQQSAVPVPSAVPTPIPSPVASPTPGSVPPHAYAINPLSLTYPLGFDGLNYNGDGSGMLSLSRDKAKSAGADITLFFDRIQVYQHHSPGVTITFWGSKFDTSGETIVGPVSHAEFVTDPFRPDLSLGPVNISVQSSLMSLTTPGSITTTVNPRPSPDVVDQYRTLADNHQLRMGSIAYTLTIGKNNISRTAPATISMGVPESWVLSNGGENAVSIGRISDETGVVELLNTSTAVRDANGDLVFQGESPNGTSLFGLLTAQATIEEQKTHPNVTYVGISQSAMVTNAGMYEWLIGVVQENPVLLVLIAGIIVCIAYFGWWKRRL